MEMKKLQHFRKSRRQNYFHDMSLKISRLWNFTTLIYIFRYYNFFPSDILSLYLHILSCIDSIWITHPATGSNLISHYRFGSPLKWNSRPLLLYPGYTHTTPTTPPRVHPYHAHYSTQSTPTPRPLLHQEYTHTTPTTPPRVHPHHTHYSTKSTPTPRPLLHQEYTHTTPTTPPRVHPHHAHYSTKSTPTPRPLLHPGYTHTTPTTPPRVHPHHAHYSAPSHQVWRARCTSAARTAPASSPQAATRSLPPTPGSPAITVVFYLAHTINSHQQKRCNDTKT